MMTTNPMFKFKTSMKTDNTTSSTTDGTDSASKRLIRASVAPNSDMLRELNLQKSEQMKLKMEYSSSQQKLSESMAASNQKVGLLQAAVGALVGVLMSPEQQREFQTRREALYRVLPQSTATDPASDGDGE